MIIESVQKRLPKLTVLDVLPPSKSFTAKNTFPLAQDTLFIIKYFFKFCNDSHDFFPDVPTKYYFLHKFLFVVLCKVVQYHEKGWINMGTIALFSGQGSQYERMGLELLEQDDSLKSIYDTAKEALGFDLYDIIANADAKTLSRTIYAQPAIMATSLVCLEAAKKRGFTYDAVAGHSLGEYAALVASGMLSMETGFQVIQARAEAMEAAASAADGAMYAILKLTPKEVEQICEETEGYVIPANYNSSVQTVIAGDRDAVERAAETCKSRKARAVPLAVASAFHTRLMQPAADAFYGKIQNVAFQSPNVAFYSNVLGDVRTDFSDMPTALAKHIVSPVRFTDELLAMQKNGIDTFVEFGPGKVLTKLVKKTLKDVTAKNCENRETLEGVLA